MVRSFQISAVFPHLTVLENVRIALQRQRGGSFDFWRSQARARRLQRARAVADRRRRACRMSRTSTAVELPYGRKRALEIATTLALDPEMLLLDEPTAGMGHEDIDRIAALIKSVAADRTVLMVEHNLSAWSRTCPTASPCSRAAACWPKATTPPSPTIRRCARPIWGWGMLDDAQPRCSTVSDLQAWYGESHILHGVDFRRARRRGGHAARPQRRRQDHDAEIDHGHRGRSAPARCASRAGS